MHTQILWSAEFDIQRARKHLDYICANIYLSAPEHEVLLSLRTLLRIEHNPKLSSSELEMIQEWLESARARAAGRS